MERTIKSSTINYGLYLGIVLIALTGIGYAINLELFVNIWFGIAFLVVILTFCIIAAVNAKKLMKGYISFKDAFTSFFLTLIIGLLINTLINSIIFNWIDPDAAITLQEMFVESHVERLESYNVPAEAIDKTIEKIEAKGNLYAPINILQSLIWQIAGYSIAGLIVAAILKKRTPEAK